MNACAVVSASPAARCGRWTGSPSAAASAVSDSVAGARPSRSASHSRPSTLRVDHRARAAARRACAAGGRGTRARPTPRARPARARPSPRAARRRPRSGAGAPARSSSRRPWIRIDSAGTVPGGRDEALARAAEHDAAAVDRHRRPGDDRVAARVEPGRLEVDDAERRLPPRRPARRQPRGPVGGRRRAPHRTPSRRSAAIRRCTPATARNASLSVLRVSGLSSRRVEEVVRLGARLELLDLVARAAGPRSARAPPRAAARRRPRSVPASAAARSRAGVEACVTPAASPAQRARSAIGTMPPRLRSSRPRCSPESSTTRPRRKPVGGRCESAN